MGSFLYSLVFNEINEADLKSVLIGLQHQARNPKYYQKLVPPVSDRPLREILKQVLVEILTSYDGILNRPLRSFRNF